MRALLLGLLLAGVIFVPVSAQGPYTVDENTVLYYDFSACAGDVVLDETDYHHDGRFDPVEGPLWTSSGMVGCGMTFDGIDDSVRADLTSMGFTAGPHTIEADIFLFSIPESGWSTFICMYSQEQQMPLRVFPDGRIHFRLARDNQDDYVDLFSKSVVETNRWYHIAGQYDGEDLAIFIDDALDTMIAIDFVPAILQRNAVDLGKMRRADLDGNDHRNWFDGVMDEVRISSCARYSTQTTLWVAFDIKPGSCPNPLNIGNHITDAYWYPETQPGIACKGGPNPNVEAPSKGGRAVLPCAVMGTEMFDVTLIDMSSLSLNGVPLVRWGFEDVGAPMPADAADCDCITAGPDGYTDLTLKFYRQEVVASLGEVLEGDNVTLKLAGLMLDGTPIEGADCVLILHGAQAPESSGSGTEEPQLIALDNFPNPFNPVTTISFSLAEGGEAKLELFNVMGQRVATLVDGALDAGPHEIEWDGSTVSSGVYFYRLTTESFVDTKKMLLLK